jgi:CRISPR-associated protein Csx17
LSFGFASLVDVQSFLNGETDDDRLVDLLWGLTLVDRGARASDSAVETRPVLLPRSYALLKLLFLPPWIVVEKHPEHGCVARAAKAPGRNGAIPLAIDPEPQIVQLLLRGDHPTACRVAMRRLRTSGLTPMPHARSATGNRDEDWEKPADVDTERLAASLLIPIRLSDINRLLNLVIRPATAAGA